MRNPIFYDDIHEPEIDHDLEDARHEARGRRPFRCCDGLCGGLDCDRCHPGYREEEGEE